MEPKKIQIRTEFLSGAFVTIDHETGYAVNPQPEAKFQPKQKQEFLQLFRECGDPAFIMNQFGFKVSVFNNHLKFDKKFKEDYEEMLLEMKHELEGTMFKNARQSGGYRDRMKWLEKNFPQEYSPAKATKKKDTDPIDALWAEATKKK